MRTALRPLSVVVLLLPAFVSAQAGDPRLLPAAAAPKHLTVAATAEPASAAPGATIALVLDVTPNPGIHVYAPGAKDYIPVALKVQPPSGVSVTAPKYPKSEILFFEPLDEHVPVYQKVFRITEDVKIDRAAKSGSTVTVTGTLGYQACDDKVCYPPTTTPVSWTVAVQD